MAASAATPGSRTPAVYNEAHALQTALSRTVTFLTMVTCLGAGIWSLFGGPFPVVVAIIATALVLQRVALRATLTWYRKRLETLRTSEFGRSG